MNAVKWLYRLEGLAIFFLSIYLYFIFQGNIVYFIVAVLAIDLGMIGYFAGKRIGSITYNATHTIIIPTVLLASGIITNNAMLMQISFVWFAHIGIDRSLGYGLKYASGFRDTHVQKL